jgi:hypothetical protein
MLSLRARVRAYRISKLYAEIQQLRAFVSRCQEEYPGSWPFDCREAHAELGDKGQKLFELKGEQFAYLNRRR